MKSLSLRFTRGFPTLLAAASLSGGSVHAQTTPDCTVPAYATNPTAATTAADDFGQMLCQLGIKYPDIYVATINGVPNPSYLSRVVDPYRPVNSWPKVSTTPEGNFTDALSHTMVRHAFGEWTTYLDPTSAGAADGLLPGTSVGGAIPLGGQGDLPSHDGWQYTPIDLLKMNDGTAVSTPDDWWNKRRPEIWEDVQKYMYGRIPDKSRWPDITWTLGTPTVATANGVDYQQTVVTGTISTQTGGPNFIPYTPRNQPVLSFTVRVPVSVVTAGTLALQNGQTPTRVPCMIGYGTQFWQYTAAQGWATATYANGSLQPDSGGASMSSYIIGLINQGGWRKPDDWGALAAWGWGVSRFFDYLEAGGKDALFINPQKVGVEGHSRYGKATIVTAAYEPRVLAAFPSCSGEAGAHMNRRQWGEAHESIGGSSEYYWVCGNWMLFNGSLFGNDGSIPRKKEKMPVDGHSVVALVAPRLVFLNGGTDTPPGNGDAWQDPQGMYLAGVNATPVYNLLGRNGLIIPAGTVFTSGANEPFGGTPPFNVAFGTGHVGWRRHIEGHTDVPDLPSFVAFASRFFNDVTPPTLGLPGAQTVVATSNAGAIVNFSALAMDNVDDQVPVVLSNASGSVFPLGTTTVTATATDISGNAASDSFIVTVTPVNVIQSGYTFNRRLGMITQQVTLTNVLSTPLTGPVYLVLDNLSGNTSLTHRTGVSSSGGSYILVSSGEMAPGATISVTLQFTNPASGGITYASSTVSGGATP